MTAVAGLFFLQPRGGGYEARGAGAAIGCVVVGAGAQYNLMFYDAAKTSLFVTPVSPAVRPSVRRRALATGAAPRLATGAARRAARGASRAC